MLCAQHLDSTPNQYIQWRYGIGEDREQLQKVNLKVSEEEEKKMAEKQVRCPSPRSYQAPLTWPMHEWRLLKLPMRTVIHATVPSSQGVRRFSAQHIAHELTSACTLCRLLMARSVLLRSCCPGGSSSAATSTKCSGSACTRIRTVGSPETSALSLH